MSQPAVRLGDPGSHAGVNVSGEPTVLIVGSPASRMGDRHVEPPPLVAHGPQVIAVGSSTVMIGGQPAARAGDLVSCGAMLVATQTSVLIGG